MLITLQISEEAKISYLNLLDWYAEIDIKLSIKFADEYLATLKKIKQNPTHYSFINNKFRRYLFSKLHCMIIYKFEKNIVSIIRHYIT